MPTFHFYVKGSLADEMKGANTPLLEQKVIAFNKELNPFSGGGHKLSEAADPHVPALSAREARLKAFASIEGERKPVVGIATAPAAVAPAVDSSSSSTDEDEALAKVREVRLSEVK